MNYLVPLRALLQIVGDHLADEIMPEVTEYDDSMAKYDDADRVVPEYDDDDDDDVIVSQAALGKKRQETASTALQRVSGHVGIPPHHSHPSEFGLAHELASVCTRL